MKTYQMNNGLTIPAIGFGTFDSDGEELYQAVLSALEAGYDKAFLTIMDSHVTALITAAVLFQFGTGPVKGFAVSLSLGIMINLFTSLMGTKVIFDLFLHKGNVKKMSI